MRFQSTFAVLSAAAISQVAAQTGQLGDATVVTNNPYAPVYRATLPDEPFFKDGSLSGNIKGSISAVGTMSGTGVAFKVKFENLPKDSFPFLYHIHVAPVPDNGNCTATQAHLDPFIRGEATPCDKNNTATCQVGDLSGKYGTIQTDPFEDTFVDPYASLVPGLGSFFGNRSFVIHFANKTRITCANFEVVPGTEPESTPGNNCSATAKGAPGATGSVTPTQSIVPFLGAATTTGAPLATLLVAMAAIMFAL